MTTLHLRSRCGSKFIQQQLQDEAFSGQNYFPDGMERPLFYAPTQYGFEAELKARLKRFAELRKERSKR